MSLCGVFKPTARQRYENRKKYQKEMGREDMGGNARTTEFLKECLSDSLIKLMKTKSVDQITVSEIAQMASVGRTTYFRNFKAKNELISFKLIKLWERWAEQNELEIRNDFSLTNTSAFFFFNYSIRELLVLIYQRERQSAVYDAFQTVLYQILCLRPFRASGRVDPAGIPGITRRDDPDLREHLRPVNCRTNPYGLPLDANLRTFSGSEICCISGLSAERCCRDTPSAGHTSMSMFSFFAPDRSGRTPARQASTCSGHRPI